MIKKDIMIKNENGLHMRPGRLFVQEAKKQSCDVTVILKNNGRTATAKSLVQLLKLGISQGHEITLICDGENEQQSATHLEKFISSLED